MRATSALKSFLESAREVCESQPEEVFTSWYDGQGNLVADHTFGDIWESSERIANYLRSECNLNDPQKHIVVLCYDFGINFFHAFLGCLRAGVVPALTYPPGPPLVKSLPKLQKVVQDCQPALILTDSRVELLRLADGMNPFSNSKGLWPATVKYVNTDRISAPRFGVHSFFTSNNKASMEYLRSFDFLDEDLAFIQYSSGSTGEPKGVMVTHGNISASVRIVRESCLQVYRESGSVPDRPIGVSWLPSYHDMGLIYGIAMPFASGWRMHMVSPLDFIRNPIVWIELLSASKAHWTVAPDFSYRLVVRKLLALEQDETERTKKRLASIDLSCVRYLQNAAEPVRLDTRDVLAEVLTKYSLSKSFFGTGYGLAENVVSVSHLHEYKLSRPTVSQKTSVLAVGHRNNIPSEFLVKIVDTAEGFELEDEMVGEIWVHGPCVTAGYFRKPELTAEVFDASLPTKYSDLKFMRTGDLGFFQDDFLFVCGRIKDVIIVNGVNYYPQDVEAVVQDASASIRPGCVAAFSSSETENDGELEVVFEVRAGQEENSHDICKLVHRAVSVRIGLVAARIVAIRERTISKTTSGKIQRRKNRERLHSSNQQILFDFCLEEEGPSQVFSTRSSATSSSFVETPRKRRSSLRPAATAEEVFDEVILSFLPKDYDPDTSWDELGMTSMNAIELQQTLCARLTSCSIPPDFVESFPTPRALRESVLTAGMRTLPVEKEKLIQASQSFSWPVFTVLQGLLIPALLLSFSVPILPAWYVGVAVSGNAKLYEDIGVRNSIARWIWLPIALPTWMTSFTLLVLLTKWIIVGRYVELEARYASWIGLRWWYVDRLVHLWEFWVGRFIKDTPLITFVYWLAGAQIHPSVRMNTFIREFDLVTIAAGSQLEHPVSCRIFSGWQADIVNLRFRKVSIGHGSLVRGMLVAGTRVGVKCYVERLSVVAEGSKAPDGTIATGNPAFDRGPAEMEESTGQWQVASCFRLVWIFCELYIFFGCLLASQLIVAQHNPFRGRYASLSYWILLIGLSNLFSLLIGIGLKWALIGKRRPGTLRRPFLVGLIDWAVDFHFRISTFIPISFSSNSRSWNLLLRLYGLNVDMASKLIPDSIPPSQMDLVTIRRSFVSNISLSTKEDGTFGSVAIEESSVGYHVHICSGVTVSRSTVSPLTILRTYRRGSKAKIDLTDHYWITVLLTEVAYLGYICLLLLSFIPTFEVWIWLEKLIGTIEIEYYVPILGLCLLLQSFTWVVLLCILQFVGAGGRKPVLLPIFSSMHTIYLNMSWATQVWSFHSIFWGSRIMNPILRLLGAKIEGRFLFNGRVVHDFPLVTFKDGSLMDSAHVAGHYQVFNRLVRGDVNIVGLLHPGTSVMANAALRSLESGPWRAYLGAAVAFDTTENTIGSRSLLRMVSSRLGFVRDPGSSPMKTHGSLDGLEAQKSAPPNQRDAVHEQSSTMDCMGDVEAQVTTSFVGHPNSRSPSGHIMPVRSRVLEVDDDTEPQGRFVDQDEHEIVFERVEDYRLQA